ncbi:MAG: hypothetical protein KAW56_01205 [Candidatus Marinimicrobia bacterium]|nr:hypothetical protein [Candidatus Neomarinimicrobiota bacterium]
MCEFKRRGLDVKYEKEIREWLKHKDEEKFSKKLDKQMRDEVERFLKERRSTAR